MAPQKRDTFEQPDVIRFLLLLISILFYISGYYSWRYGISSISVFLSVKYFLLVGTALFLAVILGKYLSLLTVTASFLPLAWALYRVIFHDWNSGNLTQIGWAVLISFGGFGLTYVLYSTGLGDWDDELMEIDTNPDRTMLCASCNTNLGPAEDFVAPCPDCGGEQYKIRKTDEHTNKSDPSKDGST
jgi:predicted RNA-binding Zn-ribbon protein involved in translation (DUF1610 family)